MLSKKHYIFLLKLNIIVKIIEIFANNNFTDPRIIMPQAQIQNGKIVFF